MRLKIQYDWKSWKFLRTKQALSEDDTWKTKDEKICTHGTKVWKNKNEMVGLVFIVEKKSRRPQPALQAEGQFTSWALGPPVSIQYGVVLVQLLQIFFFLKQNYISFWKTNPSTLHRPVPIWLTFIQLCASWKETKKKQTNKSWSSLKTS